MRQIEIVDSMVTRHVDALAISATDRTALIAPVKRAMQAGIPVTVFDSGLDVKGYVTFVATDNYGAGQTAARKLAELIQMQMGQRFRGSSETPFEAPVRQLRTLGAPAVAIEVSSVSVANRSALDQMGPGLADGVARAVAAFRTIYESGGR